MTYQHQPVLADAVVSAAAGARRAVDGTLGGGGHAALLRNAGAQVLGIDRDPAAIEAAMDRLGAAGIEYHTGNFGSPAALQRIHDFHPDFILLDLGVSSPQLDAESRGFTFRPGAPLDMRMAPEGPTAADLVNQATEAELALVFHDYGDERRARSLAREIVRRRSRAPLVTSDDLVNAIRAVLGPRSGPGDFARLFQAVRIAVNSELTVLSEVLPRLRDALEPGGRLAVISYHSGEDRIAKHLFREWSQACVCPPALPRCQCRGRPLGRTEPRHPIRPTAAETAANPRARSAILRIFRTE